MTSHTYIETNPCVPGEVSGRTPNWLERLKIALEKNIFLHVLPSCAIGILLISHMYVFRLVYILFENAMNQMKLNQFISILCRRQFLSSFVSQIACATGMDKKA